MVMWRTHHNDEEMPKLCRECAQQHAEGPQKTTDGHEGLQRELEIGAGGGLAGNTLTL